MDYGINRNASGYYDPTAFEAIKKYIRSEEKNMEIYEGDIVEIELANRTTREAVILSVHNSYSTILILTENESLPYMVNCRGMKYTDPGMVQYIFNDKVKQLIRSMKKDEIDDLLHEVVEYLGYKAPVKEIVKEVAPKPAPEPVEFVRQGQFMVPETEALKADLTKAQAERDVYKSLYENLISSMIAK